MMKNKNYKGCAQGKTINKNQIKPKHKNNQQITPHLHLLIKKFQAMCRPQSPE